MILYVRTSWRVHSWLLLGACLLFCGTTARAQDASAGVVTMPPAVPATQRLTLSQAQTVAKADNLQIIQAQHQTESQRANLAGQSAPLNPTIDYAALNNSLGPFDGFDNAANYSAYLTLETSGRERLRTNQARAQLKGAQADEQTAHLTVEQAVVDAYSNLQVANDQLDNERNVYNLTDQLSTLTHKQFELGAAPEANAIRADIALTQERQNLLAAVETVEQARSDLNVQLARDPRTPVDVVEPLMYGAVTIPAVDTLIAQAMQTRPEIRSAVAAVDAARANVGLQRSQSYPDTQLGTGLNGGGVEIGLTLPLLDFGSIRGSVNTAKEQVKVQQAEADQEELTVKQDVQDGVLGLTEAKEAVELYQSGVLPQTKSLLERVTQGFQLGGSTILDIIDAQQTYRQTRNSYYAAIGSYNIAVDQLNRAVGATAVTPAPGAQKPALDTEDQAITLINVTPAGPAPAK